MQRLTLTQTTFPFFGKISWKRLASRYSKPRTRSNTTLHNIITGGNYITGQDKRGNRLHPFPNPSLPKRGFSNLTQPPTLKISEKHNRWQALYWHGTRKKNKARAICTRPSNAVVGNKTRGD